MNEIAYFFGQILGLVICTSPVWGAILVTVLIMKRKNKK